MSATNRGAVRLPDDAYYTPATAVKSLKQVLQLPAGLKAYEPCIGTGIIPRVFKELEWHGSDINIPEGLDYLQNDLGYSPATIITNPPFSLAQDFLLKSLAESFTVIYLLRLNFLGAKKRKAFWKAHPPTHLFPLSQRPSFTGSGTDATDYAWFGWDYSLEEFLGKPRIEVL